MVDISPETPFDLFQVQLNRIEANTIYNLQIGRALTTTEQANWAKLFANQANLRSLLSEAEIKILDGFQSVLDKLDALSIAQGIAVSARVRVPTYRNLTTGKEITVPQNLMNDVISNLPVEFDNLAGTPVAPPASGTVTVSLVDASGSPSALGTAALGADGTSIDVFPNKPAGSVTGDAVVKFDDNVNGGTSDDISFTFPFTFTNDSTATSAHVDTTKITTRPLT